MAKKRRLTDLYVIGKPVTLDDGQGDSVTVFVRKMNPIDHENALRNANAARARVMTAKKHPETPEYQEVWLDVIKFQRDDIEDYLKQDEAARRKMVIEAELETDEEWAKDDYLQGLRDALEAGIEDDGERERAEADVKRFDDKVDELLNAELDDLAEAIEDKTIEELQEQVFEKQFELRASIAWLSEYRRSEVWRATREEDQKTYYFTSREEVDELPIEVLVILQEAYQSLAVEPLEGKGSQGTDSSSHSSESPESQVVEPVSFPEGANA